MLPPSLVSDWLFFPRFASQTKLVRPRKHTSSLGVRASPHDLNRCGSPTTCRLWFDQQQGSFQCWQQISKNRPSSGCEVTSEEVRTARPWEACPSCWCLGRASWDKRSWHTVTPSPGHPPPKCPWQDTRSQHSTFFTQKEMRCYSVCAPSKHKDPTEWDFLIN